MRTFYSILIVLFVLGCKEQPTQTADKIIENAIAASCQGNCTHATIDFDFRKKHYKSIRQGGAYHLEREFTDSLGVFRDVLSNDGFSRYKNDSLLMLADTTKLKFSESINSVHYFAQLPYGLHAAAAKKRVVGETTIHNKEYYKIEVTFAEENGGVDFEDVFVYWIHKETYFVDYFAYSYTVNGGGIRFREAYNARTVNGIRFVDYNNYKPANSNIALTKLDTLFEQNELQLLSKIETENVVVKTLPKE